ncbi:MULTISPECIES: hypothetical protein [Moorella (nom. illeg.)]|uniref:Uncharacterized protein n=2 Tax=Neomoorella TaxID=44260 RepID=A0A2T0AKN6_9FIRM|nr:MULTISPECIES: hypothetical protein [Moorella]KYH32480.1 hypothetical protein MOMUL_10810 [Moorella mulderi DSM 14980]PRR69150.1 hypothetical protein MOHU_24530 [Moorella humiferrea]
MTDKEISDRQKTFRHELIREESPEELWNLEAKGEVLRENPYKTPPNNLTTKRDKE